MSVFLVTERLPCRNM